MRVSAAMTVTILIRPQDYSPHVHRWQSLAQLTVAAAAGGAPPPFAQHIHSELSSA